MPKLYSAGTHLSSRALLGEKCKTKTNHLSVKQHSFCRKPGSSKAMRWTTKGSGWKACQFMTGVTRSVQGKWSEWQWTVTWEQQTKDLNSASSQLCEWNPALKCSKSTRGRPNETKLWRLQGVPWLGSTFPGWTSETKAQVGSAGTFTRTLNFTAKIIQGRGSLS